MAPRSLLISSNKSLEDLFRVGGRRERFPEQRRASFDSVKLADGILGFSIDIEGWLHRIANRRGIDGTDEWTLVGNTITGMLIYPIIAEATPSKWRHAPLLPSAVVQIERGPLIQGMTTPARALRMITRAFY